MAVDVRAKRAFWGIALVCMTWILVIIALEITAPTKPSDSNDVIVSGISLNKGVASEFYFHLSNYEYQKVANHITAVQKGDVSALKKLVRYDCGGGAGCYGLGHILAQLAHQLGDDKISQMAEQLNETDKEYFDLWLGMGLEYGYGIPMPDEQEKALPKLHAVLKN